MSGYDFINAIIDKLIYMQSIKQFRKSYHDHNPSVHLLNDHLSSEVREIIMIIFFGSNPFSGTSKMGR